MAAITSIEQLIECFDDAEPSEQVRVLKNIDIPISEFKEFATWTEGEYTRNCLARKEDFEFILLCWDKGAKTPIHGHDDQDCWVYQVDGSVKEKRYKESAESFQVTNESVLNPGRVTYMHDRMGYHSIENIGRQRAMTLHVYAKPIDQCKVYNEEKACFEICEMEYDTVHEDVIL